jgi:uncharacterized protein
MKIIFLLVAGFLIWWILRTLMSNRNSPSRKPRVKNMCACKICGLHIPEDEAIKMNGVTYCSKEHAKQDTP